VKASLARFTRALMPRIDGPSSLGPGSGGKTMKAIFRTQTVRVILALMTLASSALVIQAGHRWF
jgi:hypothetical protein